MTTDTNTDVSTARRLAEMSDVAAFERLAAAILRAANPNSYANLSHPGVQPGGKTVKGSFDNIGWLQSAEGAHFVCAAHTTEQKDLEGKWLHDPTKVKPRKAGGKPTKPAGDLIKGIEEIQRLRESHPGLAVTLALTTNKEPSLELRVSVEDLARSAAIELDVWSVSRLAHFLDTDPIGQIIRRNQLGTPVKLLSRGLLLEMGRRSICDHLPHAMTGENIRRDDFTLGHGDTLVVGSSGTGKTTACAMALDVHIGKGLPALVLKAEFLATAATIEEAIEGELRRQQPEIEASTGRKVLSLCTEEEPILLLIEDINRATSPSLLLNKILAWSRPVSQMQSSRRTWRAICPLWPRYIDVIEDQKRVLANVTMLRVDRYSRAEAIRAICKRAEAIGLTIDDHRAVFVAERLGRDPLLIGLHDLAANEVASNVIQSYVDERLGLISGKAQLSRSEVVNAVRELLHNMLHRRILNPHWTEIRSWIKDQNVIDLLRTLLHDGSVIRIAFSGMEEALEFRHDRIMNCLLSDAVASAFKTEDAPDYINDPFFSEVVAGAAVQVQLPLRQLVKLMEASPVVAAYALKLASEFGSNYVEVAAEGLNLWQLRGDGRHGCFVVIDTTPASR